MFDRRTFTLAALAAPLVAATATHAETAALPLDDDGLHVQPWLMQTFLDMREDFTDTAAAGKRFAVLWEQRGCPYCREMHAVNFADPEIVSYLTDKFGILRLNLWGSRLVTDFDGEEIEERELARKWRVNFTPTIVFLDDKLVAGKSGFDHEIARMPGYFKPFHFLSMFHYVSDKAYADTDFQRYLQARFKDLEDKGIKPKIW
jgi:thioredoxin-related protein